MPGANLREQRTARAGKEVGLKIGMVIVEHAKVVVTNTVVKVQTGRNLEGVLRVDRPLLIAVAAREAGLGGG